MRIVHKRRINVFRSLKLADKIGMLNFYMLVMEKFQVKENHLKSPYPRRYLFFSLGKRFEEVIQNRN